VASVLLESGAQPDATNKIGQTALIYAVIEQHLSMIKLLLDKGADVNLGNSLHWGWAPIHWAALSDNLEIVEAVLSAEGVKNVKDMSGRYPGQLAEEHAKERVAARLAALPKD